MRLVRGRGFTSADVPSSELVVVVNETFANRWGSHKPDLCYPCNLWL
jgi:hypothetical protein